MISSIFWVSNYCYYQSVFGNEGRFVSLTEMSMCEPKDQTGNITKIIDYSCILLCLPVLYMHIEELHL